MSSEPGKDAVELLRNGASHAGSGATSGERNEVEGERSTACTLESVLEEIAGERRGGEWTRGDQLKTR